MILESVPIIKKGVVAAAFVIALAGLAPAYALGDDDDDHRVKQEQLDENHKEYVYGIPDVPTASWTMSSGGRYYDNWMNAKDFEGIEETHPAWPAANTDKSGAATWRCKACHGWDYKGSKGAYAEGSYKTGITGVIHFQGTRPDEMVDVLRDATHLYTPEMISDEEILRIGLFISRGLHDVDAYISRDDNSVNGSAARGATYFQNVCAACHGFQGTRLDWGSPGDPAYVGTEANALPREVLHKILNGHPGAEMIASRPFGLQVAVDLLTYTQTLPEK